MPKAKKTVGEVKLTLDQIQYLEARMTHLAERNVSWDISKTDYSTLYTYLAVQKISYLYDDELFEGLGFLTTREPAR